jgi:hypothetical protein
LFLFPYFSLFVKRGPRDVLLTEGLLPESLEPLPEITTSPFTSGKKIPILSQK